MAIIKIKEKEFQRIFRDAFRKKLLGEESLFDGYDDDDVICVEREDNDGAE